MKKYRWNWKKCMKNIGTLVFRICVTGIVLVLLAAAPVWW